MLSLGYPQADEKQFDLAAETEMAILQDLIVSVRNLRAELKVEPKVKVPIEVFAPGARHPEDDRAKSRCGCSAWAMSRRSRLWRPLSPTVPAPAARPASTSTLIYESKIDVAAESDRLKKELEKIEKEFANNQRQLGNEQFLAKAPQKVVEGLRRRGQELVVLKEKTKSKLKELRMN